ncbi:hypothetical protein AQJ64_22745 [Streptomyces griseoruber]|uniref:Uncharacterized protein n=1 Tax=Streptomyces griseoruber TaxID=1943 RepID=A0A101SW16_9ACTN|nr:hypothetical protein AQJ64_22745 [Streptomyces griseoruber]
MATECARWPPADGPTRSSGGPIRSSGGPIRSCDGPIREVVPPSVGRILADGPEPAGPVTTGPVFRPARADVPRSVRAGSRATRRRRLPLTLTTPRKRTRTS